MKDVTIFETAVRLKEAGFPQPTPEAGQFWYYIRFPDGTKRKNVLCVLAHEYPYQDNLEALPLDGGEHIYNSRNTQVFAPTATDILRELPNYYYIRKHKYDSDSVNMFSIFCELQQGAFAQIAKGVDINPSEAAAEAWLKLNKKK